MQKDFLTPINQFLSLSLSGVYLGFDLSLSLSLCHSLTLKPNQRPWRSQAEEAAGRRRQGPRRARPRAPGPTPAPTLALAPALARAPSLARALSLALDLAPGPSPPLPLPLGAPVLAALAPLLPRKGTFTVPRFRI